MTKALSALLVFALLYGAVIIPFTSSLRDKPFIAKLGYVPSITALKTLSSGHKEFAAASLVLKTTMYFGGLYSEKALDEQIAVVPEYQAMSRMMHGAVQLDPYNMDAYYFAQAFLTWDVHQYKIANEILDYGMKYRDWDWTLPFYAGFNSAYFLKDYAAAARYYQRAGELSGANLSKLLAGRYMQESGRTDLAIAYLSAMLEGEKSASMKKVYVTRLRAFQEISRIELARDKYRESTGAAPLSVRQLYEKGYLVTMPVDPYGGEFYLEQDGRVATTSKFAPMQNKKNRTNKSGESDERH